MEATEPLDLAARASNLDEQLRVVAALGGPGALPGGIDALDAVDRWRTEVLAGKLAGKFHQESLHRGTAPQHTKEELVAVLAAYRLLQRGLDGTGAADGIACDLLRDIHRAWLPTYQAALAGLDAPPGPYEARANWRRPEVHQGRLARACEPFLRELGRALHAVRLEAQARGAHFAPAVVDGIQDHFLDRFELALAWAVEADAKVHCASAGIDAEAASADDYLRYLDETFTGRDAYHRFYLKFPVLARWLAHTTALLTAFGRELLESLAADRARIAEEFFGRPIAAFRSVRLGDSDPHAGGRTVARITVVLEGGGTGEFFHKPRSVRCEAALQDLLGVLTADGVLDFATRPVLPRDGYGYEALIPSGRNHVATEQEAGHIYRELGGYLALFYVLGGSDLHFENVLVADGHAFVCDAETVLGVRPQGRSQSDGTLLDSVFRTGLLEWPRAAPPAGQAAGGMRISGYAGGEGFVVPMPVPRVNEHRLTFRAAVEHRSDVRVTGSGANRVFLGGELVRPEDQTVSILDGFDRVYSWFAKDPDRAVDLLMELFSATTARFINRSTQVYAQLTSAARHPKCLAEPLEVDLLANTVRTFPRAWDTQGVLAQREVAALWRLDVPIFSATAHARRLQSDHTGPVPVALEISPIEQAAERIRRLDEHNRDRQRRYIAAGLTTGEISSPSFAAASLDCARRVGDRLCREAQDQDGDEAATWISYEISGGRLVEAAVETDLYHGSAGIALFLGYLDHLAPDPAYRAAARRALGHVLAGPAPDRMGAFTGLGGTIYLLTHLSRLWDEPELLARAAELSDQLPERIEKDRHFDVLHGAAGLIPVLLGLADATGGHGLDHAVRCGEHLLRHAVADGTALSWPPFTPDEAYAHLTGFSHGAGGIGWALIELGTRTDRPEFVAAGRSAFAYEARHFDDQEHDWYDLRTNNGAAVKGARHFSNAWCNGAAGIGMARIAAWAALGASDEQLLLEAYQALDATLRNFPRLQNHSLCHGTSGNAEFMLRFAELRDEPAFRLEANVQVQSLWRDFEEIEGGATEHSAHFFPGLLLGSSGFGLHFLRLAAPERVPCVLLLDPPPHPAR